MISDPQAIDSRTAHVTIRHEVTGRFPAQPLAPLTRMVLSKPHGSQEDGHV